MIRTTRSLVGRRLAAATLASLATLHIAAACGGGESSTVRIAEARSVESLPPAVVTVVKTPPTFTSPDAAFSAGEYRIATEMYRARLGDSTTDASSWYMMGLSTWKSGDLPGARMAFARSLELDPQFTRTYWNAARVLLDMKRSPEALEMVERGRKIDSLAPEGYRLKARAQFESKDVDGALATYKQLLIAFDDDAWGLNNLGVLLISRGEFSEAVGPLSRAVLLKPTAPVFQNNLGTALERSGYPVAALVHYELAVKHDPKFKRAIGNVERLKGTVNDSTGVEVDVKETAEQFRTTIKEWKDAAVHAAWNPPDAR